MSRSILHVLSSPHLGGAEWMCLYLAQEQMRTGNNVRVHFFEDGAASAKAKELGLKVELQNVTTYSRQARWQALAHGLKRSLQTHPPEIIHSHTPLTNLICHRVAPKMKVPWVATAHGSWRQFGYAPQTVKKPWLRPYLLLRHALGDRLTLRSAARIVAISDYVKRELHQIGIPEQNIVRIYDGLPVQSHPAPAVGARESVGFSTDALIIGSLGYFAPVKGFDILIRAFARLAPHHNGLVLAIAGGDVLGDSAYRCELHQLVGRFGLQNRVRLLSSVNPSAGFLSALDIFVVASRSEGFSLSLVEAMQHGKPSVVTSAGGALEAARPDKEALVFRSGNIFSLAEKLEQLVINGSMRSAYGKSALERAQGYLTITRCCSEYDQLYATVIQI